MPELMDIFDQDAFRMVSLTAAVNRTPYAPDFLGSLGLFTPTPIRTEDAAVVINDDGAIEVVQTTPRGAAPFEQKIQPQNIRSFRTPRVAVADTIRASELMGIISRASMMGGGDAMVLADLQSEIAYRLDGPIGLRSKQEATKERMRLGAISGVVIDKDGSVLYDWPELFGTTLPAEIDFNLDAASPTPGVLNTLLRQMARSILRAAKAGNRPGVTVMALAGDDFFDKFVAHPDVYTQYGAYANGVAQRVGSIPNVGAFGSFRWGEIDWINYRGTDDNATIAIAPDKVKFVPVGIPGLFQEVLSPGEWFDVINQPGLPIYVLTVPDRDRNAFVRLETYSYPMYLCTRPELLFSGRLT